jgi:hypothetical protein
MVLKYFIVGIILSVGLVFVYMMDIKQRYMVETKCGVWEEIHCHGKGDASKESEDMARIRAILTIAGLMMTGAITGFFCFRYKYSREGKNDLIKSNEKGTDFHGRVILGHIITGAQLVVIAMLMFLSLRCLSELKVSFVLWIYFLFVGIALLVSLISYDIFDFQR